MTCVGKFEHLAASAFITGGLFFLFCTALTTLNVMGFTAGIY